MQMESLVQITQPNLSRILRCFAYLGLSIWTSSVFAQTPLDSVLAKVTGGARELDESQQRQVLVALKSTDQRSVEKGITIFTIYLHYADDDGDNRDRFQKLLSEEITSLIYRGDHSDYTIGALAAISTLDGLLNEEAKDRVSRMLLSSNDDAAEVFLAMAPYTPWRFAKKGQLWRAPPDSGLLMHLKQLFKNKELRDEVFDSCLAAVELRTCNLDDLLLLFETLAGTPDMESSDFRRMFSIIRIGRLAGQTLEGPGRANAVKDPEGI